jgi:anaerobic carbon-monoxide dehydrogenase catalytic subunit
MATKLRSIEERTADTGVQQMLRKAQAEGIETAFDRADLLEPRCKFGLAGVCCKRCLEGPCRISLTANGPQRGVCGATADQIVARNLLTLVTEGAVPHVEHAREVALTLLEASEGKAPFEIKDPDKLIRIAQGLGLTVDGKEVNELGKEVALAALSDFQRQYGTLEWMKLKGIDSSIEKWNNLGISPVNGHLEIAKAVNRQAMGVDADPVNLIKGILTMGLVDGYSGLHIATDLQDILFGTPELVKAEYRLGVIKEDYVNIAVHGHMPIMAEKVVEWAEKVEEEAIQLGAKGINIVGICCTANELLMRKGISVATNYASQELAIVTGALDVLITDVQCIMPGLKQVADCYHTELISTIPYAKVEGASYVEFTPEKADEFAQEIVLRALSRYKMRDSSKVEIPNERVEAYAGFSVEQIVAALKKLDQEDPLKPLVDNIVSGNVLGAVAIVGCTSPRLKQDWYNVELAKHLLKHNVLIVGTGCSAHSLAKFGLMAPSGREYCAPELKAVLEAIGQANGLESLPPALHMGSCVDNSRIDDLLVALAKRIGVGVGQLPVAGSCPETHSPKALAIGTFFLNQGVDVHIGVPAPIEGSSVVSKALFSNKGDFPVTTDELFGSKLIYEPDPIKAADILLERIIQKREALGLPVPAFAH